MTHILFLDTHICYCCFDDYLKIGIQFAYSILGGMIMDNEMMIMQLIAKGGDARSSAMRAISLARKSKIEDARVKLKEGRGYVNDAHHIQTSLIQKEASGEKQEISLLLIHAQDHLMNAMTVLDMAEEFVNLYQERN